jgi:hypothetical protein
MTIVEEMYRLVVPFVDALVFAVIFLAGVLIAVFAEGMEHDRWRTRAGLVSRELRAKKLRGAG